MKDKISWLPKAAFLSFTLLILLAGLYFGRQIEAKKAPAVQGPNIVSILQLMLTGDTTWQSVQAKGFSKYEGGQQFDLRLEVIQRSSAGNYLTRAETDEKGSNPSGSPANFNFVWVNNGKKTKMVETGFKVYMEGSMVFGGQPPDRLPKASSNPGERFVIPHPFELSVRSPLAAFLFPAGRAQQLALDLDKVRVIGEGQAAGREAAILWYQVDKSIEELWVDKQTGVILKGLMFARSWLGKGRLISDVEITSITFDQVQDMGQFDVDVTGMTELSTQKFDAYINEHR